MTTLDLHEKDEEYYRDFRGDDLWIARDLWRNGASTWEIAHVLAIHECRVYAQIERIKK